ncbi:MULTISPECIES: stability/partitioning determinant [Pseudomonas syringae group]|uniref:Stability/partitioning determinant n=1 Tax=Pseudomonas amygdali pv. morsprunorum TaxID=129138 RepID=A0AB35RB09_PSEA0|nr:MULTISPECIES: stability/partitioning determinant [Pseudomonas syringae group]MDT3238952.1 stability/partitioning determinant [Pseudomonas syringae pv. tomato]MDT3243934.1 stability/partitioning determinant [Pseudomonas amygdali pv. morsprunorum]QBI65938.1 stability/partitioning determinant [Pseudomonas syringae]QBI66027.1 stability/partitioning determinant [Pseudomonas syringae]
MSRVDPLESLKDFTPKAATDLKAKQTNAEVEIMAHELGFVGRQATKLVAPATRSQRRHKTGRNIQINIKGDQETKDELYRVADDIDQPLGETLKRALAALKREISE